MTATAIDDTVETGRRESVLGRLKLENYRAIVSSGTRATCTSTTGGPGAAIDARDADARDDQRGRAEDAARFAASWQQAGAHDDGADVLAMLHARHADPARRYHTLQHVREALALLDAWGAHAERGHEIALALWFHHACHDVHRHDNEARSGQLALESLVRHGAPAPVARRVRDMVLATRRDGPTPSNDGRLLLDLDAAILAAAPARFAQAERQLRDEVPHVPDVVYRRKRLQALRCLLARSRLYATPVAQRALDERARANLLHADERAHAGATAA